MPRLLLILILTAPVFLFTSCFKDDEQVTPHVPGNYITDTVALTDNYKNQVYYSLLDSTAVLTNHKDSWDLGFESSPRGWCVILNSSCFMKSAYLADQEFGSAVDTVGAQWLFNPSDGSADSLAIGKWLGETFSFPDSHIHQRSVIETLGGPLSTISVCETTSPTLPA